MKMQKNFLDVKFELKSNSSDENFAYFEGYASTYGNIDRVDDIIEQGAFDKSIASGKTIKMLWQHKFSEVIGSYPELKNDAHGLFVKGRINLGTEKGREAYSLLKAGDIDSMSIGFFIPKDGSEYRNNIRHIKEINLFEISLVTEPANTLAMVSTVKSIESITSIKDINDYLQDIGLSNNERNALISKVKSVLKAENEDELFDDICKNLKNCL